MVQSTCSIVNCGRKVRARGFCDAHYQRVKKYGGPLAEKPIESRAQVRPGAVCSVDGCDLPATTGRYQMCGPHYKRVWRYGDPQSDTPVLKGRKSPVPVVEFGDGTRQCQCCGMAKPLSEFHDDNKSPGGKRTTCKVCRREVEKLRYRADPEKFKARMRESRRDDPERHRRIDMERYERHRENRIAAANYYTQLRRSRLAGAEVEPGVTLKALRDMDGDECCYCGLQMVFASFERGTRPDEQATLEHILPISKGGGHTFENCALACWRCNISKGAADGWNVRAGHRLAAEVIEVGA